MIVLKAINFIKANIFHIIIYAILSLMLFKQSLDIKTLNENNIFDLEFYIRDLESKVNNIDDKADNLEYRIIDLESN
jgi:hypothetical protein